MPPHELDQPRARRRLHGPVSGVRFVGAVEKQRPVQKPGDPTTLGMLHYRIEPGRLSCFLRVAAAEQHRVEADEANALDILDPAVQAEIGSPPRQPLVGHRLTGVAGIADIVIAGDCPKAHPERAYELGRVPQIVLDIGPVDRDVPGVDDEIGALLGDPGGKRRPVIGKMRFAGT